MSFVGTEKRLEPRVPFYCPVEFILRNEPDRVLKGAVRDVSRSGLGLASYTELIVGEEIIIKTIVPTSHREYAVRWLVKVRDDLFSVGLRAIE